MNKAQQNRLLTVAVVIGLLVIVLVVAGPFFILNEGEQAVVTRFGQIVDSHQEAGLRIKMPLIDNVVVYPKKVLSWDSEAQLMPTAEKQFIWVDVTARWRIKDPNNFYARINTINAANSRLTDVIESSVRTIVAENNLSAAVRNSNIINEVDVKDPTIIAEEDLDASSAVSRQLLDLIETTETYPSLNSNEGRRKLSLRMLASAAPVVDQLGIEIIDILIRQIRYSDQVTQNVYERMISERNRIAQAYRSVGEGRKKELEGQMQNELKAILSDAYKKSETIKGTADGLASRIYSNAYRQDSEFFTFWRAMESYRRTLGNFDKTLSTDMDYFRYLYSINGR